MTVASNYNVRVVVLISHDAGFHNVTLFTEAEPIGDIKVLALRELVLERNLKAVERLKDLSDKKVRALLRRNKSTLFLRGNKSYRDR